MFFLHFCSDRQGSRRGALQTVPARRTSRVDSPSAQEHPQTPSRLRERASNVRGVLPKVGPCRREGGSGPQDRHGQSSGGEVVVGADM